MNKDEEKKEYQGGTVQISSQEYRDIIEENIALKNRLGKAEDRNSELSMKKYDMEREKDRIEARLKESTEKLNNAIEFINQSEDRKAAYKGFLFDKQQKEEEEDDE